MILPVSTCIKRTAYELIRQVHKGLEDQDIEDLRTKGPILIQEARHSLQSGKNPLEQMDDEDKRLLLAYIIFLRQNVTTDASDNPNDEDAAAILHKEVYKDSDKKFKTEMETELLIQMQKAGLPIKIVMKDDEK